VLVAWGSKRGGTERIARIIADELKTLCVGTALVPASEVHELRGYDAAIVGGALYANRRHRDARRLLARHIAALRRILVWLFSSGPLDAPAEDSDIPPLTDVAVLMERIGACGHMTFGGRLSADAKGCPAAAMAKTLSGDWPNPERIRAWTHELARALRHARPRPALDRRRACLDTGSSDGHSTAANRLQWCRGCAARGCCAAHLHWAGDLAISVHEGRDPLPTATVFTATVAVLDAVIVAGLLRCSPTPPARLPLGLIFLATWITGLTLSLMPAPRPAAVANRSPRVPREHESGAGAYGWVCTSDGQGYVRDESTTRGASS
jgi:menaquinone-dependent protoporphyrinogen oxidase